MFLTKASVLLIASPPCEWRMDFPGGSDGKESACNVGDVSLIPGLGRSPGEENRNALQCPCWEIPQTEELSRARLRD